MGYTGEKQNAYMKLRRDKNKADNLAWFIEFQGEIVCAVCGYHKSLAAIDFHHVDSTQKNGSRDSFGMWLYGEPAIFRDKIKSIEYMMLCANCHRELHERDRRSKSLPNDGIGYNSARKLVIAYGCDLIPMSPELEKLGARHGWLQ